MPAHLGTDRGCSYCSYELVTRNSHEEGGANQLSEHALWWHGREEFDWESDTTGGYCRLCWHRAAPGEMRHHWEDRHHYYKWAPFSHQVDPRTLRSYHGPVSARVTEVLNLPPVPELAPGWG